MQAIDKYDLIRIVKEPNLKTLTLNEVLYAIERAAKITTNTATRRKLTPEELHDYIECTERRFDCICTACESLCFATDNYCAGCGAELEDV
jgi:hypothetical protein